MPEPLSNPASAAQPPVTATLVVYAMFAIAAITGLVSSGLVHFAPLVALAGIVGVIIAYVKRGKARGTWVESHLDWLIGTFWWSLLWDVVAIVIGVLTFWILGLGILLAMLILAATSAYAFSRYKFRGRSLGLTFLFATQLIPGIMLLVPIFLLAAQLKLTGTYQGLVIAYSVTAIPFSIWILKGYYDTVPVDLEEAALIDGCSEFQAFRKVLLPLSVPALAIVFLFNFLAAWGEYFTARVLIGGKEELLTWPLGIQRFQQQFQTQWADLSASAIIVSVPIVILFVYVSKYLVSGLTLGGVKG